MKRITTVLLTGAAALFMTACGGGSSDSGTIQPPPESTPPSGIIGSGTIEDPYIVGSGEYTFTGSKYFEVYTNRTECNVIAYNIRNLNPWGQTKMFDSSYSEIPQEKYGYTYKVSDIDTYIIEANSYEETEEAILGIYSPCIDQPNSSYTPDKVLINSLNSFSVNDSLRLYKFDLDSNSIVETKDISNTDRMYYYDVNLNYITHFEGYEDDKTLELSAGSYYLLVSQFGFGSEETPTFYFSVESK
ncbi:hypothetical protein [Sulfurovum riftiae]|uniref:Lipoprotein n=1 Tax=Sulfurovum riftiae TaxID=1630136 RepID=A0A151CJ20_9BACT|nr:hypothetical protein [Sulfurovum riftiae]KYJ87525.1 hypothetical protein AS592_10485 [Sulfurovum riftiae]